MFRLFDRQVRFDSAKSGWPWTLGTVSWVAPTALSILAFRTRRGTHLGLRLQSLRFYDPRTVRSFHFMRDIADRKKTDSSGENFRSQPKTS